jgi:hypothetical protein
MRRYEIDQIKLFVLSSVSQGQHNQAWQLRRTLNPVIAAILLHKRKVKTISMWVSVEVCAGAISRYREIACVRVPNASHTTLPRNLFPGRQDPYLLQQYDRKLVHLRGAGAAMYEPTLCSSVRHHIFGFIAEQKLQETL